MIYPFASHNDTVFGNITPSDSFLQENAMQAERKTDPVDFSECF